ncbi:MAG: sodium:proton antiporter [Gemmatimonadota bacterium]
MDAFNLFAVLTALAALFGWLNHKYIRLPTTIGLMVISMVFSIALLVLGRLGAGVVSPLVDMISSVQLDEALLHGMLGALLFAGALHVEMNDLAEQKWIILLLATTGTLISATTVAVGTFYIFAGLGLDVPFVTCLLFGSLIAPTDPIAVGSILRKLGVPASLLTKITGESLFNDGVGVVLFLALLGVASGGHGVSLPEVAELLVVEVGGGVLYGAALGWVVFRMLKSIDNYQVEILLTLALVTAGYAFAAFIHVSGPLAMVVSGLMIGNQGRTFAMSDLTRERLDAFWEMVDEFLNALLFVMIGVELLILAWEGSYVVAGLLTIPLVLGARFISVGIPIVLRRPVREFSPHVIKILTWAGLRGGISVALALSLPADQSRDLLLTVTYVVVSFSIIVQGLTVERLLRSLAGPSSEPDMI